MLASHRLELRRSIEFILWCAALCCAVIVPLLLGQLLRLRATLWPLSPQSIELIGELIYGGSFILLEVALPIAVLSAGTISVRRWRAHGEYLDWWCIGGSPFTFLRPIFISSIGICACNLYLSEVITPRTIRQLSEQALNLSKSNRRGLVPQAISQIRSNDFLPKGQRRSMWLIESPVNNESRGKAFTYLMCSVRISEELRRAEEDERPNLLSIKDHSLSSNQTQCLSAWWTESDEHDDSISIQELWLITPAIQIKLQELELAMPSLSLGRINKTFGPPNSLDSRSLSTSVHHRFIWLKRKIVPLYCLLFAILASWAGLSLNAIKSAVSGLFILCLGFGALRGLELCSRSGWCAPELAAVAPALLLAILCILALRDLSIRHPQAL